LDCGIFLLMEKDAINARRRRPLEDHAEVVSGQLSVQVHCGSQLVLRHHQTLEHRFRGQHEQRHSCRLNGTPLVSSFVCACACHLVRVRSATCVCSLLSLYSLVPLFRLSIVYSVHSCLAVFLHCILELYNVCFVNIPAKWPVAGSPSGHPRFSRSLPLIVLPPGFRRARRFFVCLPLLPRCSHQVFVLFLAFLCWCVQRTALACALALAILLCNLLLGGEGAVISAPPYPHPLIISSFTLLNSYCVVAPSQPSDFLILFPGISG